MSDRLNFGPYAPNARIVDKLKYDAASKNRVFPPEPSHFGFTDDNRPSNWEVCLWHDQDTETYIRGYSCEFYENKFLSGNDFKICFVTWICGDELSDDNVPHFRDSIVEEIYEDV